MKEKTRPIFAHIREDIFLEINNVRYSDETRRAFLETALSAEITRRGNGNK
jgi:hypothetical protein|uniref:Uncharacterized protein n=1 Tax=uncultured marine virus TaxID=186617 RepID=A0A0F7L3Y1_9VIRU|nr:hypothetical protein [uncultured marine virus]